MAANRTLRGEVKALAPYSWQTPTMESPYVSRAINCQGANSEFVKIVGGTVGWNQLADNSNAPSNRDGLVITGGTSSFTVNGTASATDGAKAWFKLSNDVVIPLVNHVLFYSFKLVSGTISDNDGSKFAPISNTGGYYISVGGETVQKLPSSLTSSTGRAEWRYASGAVFTNAEFRIQVIDLTSLFGTSIADYAYTLEQQSAGSGIQWLRSFGFFLSDYYPYSATTLESVQTSAHVIKDADGNVIGTYPTSDVILRGITELVGDEIRYNGDTYEWDGTVTRKWIERTLTADMVGEVGTASTGVKYARVGETTFAGNKAICDKYINVSSVPSDSGYFRIIGGSAYFYDNAFTDLATAKSLLTGVKLVCELATPTTESADPFTSPMTIYEGGTEEWVDAGTRDFEMPVGNESSYAGLYPDLGLSPLGLTAQITLVDPFA